MNRIDRNKILVRYIVSTGIAASQKDLGLKLGYKSESAFSQVINEKVEYPKDFIDRLCRILPALNRDWLLCGEGEMLKKIEPQAIVSDITTEYSASEAQADEVISVPFVDKVTAATPDIDVRDLVREKGHTLEEFPFYKMVKGVDYIQTVITMAMAPRYLPGDYLFIRFRNGQVLSGKIYLVDTRIYGTMLRYVYIEEGGYTLKALNPEFKDVFVKSEDVYSISSVALSVNANTSLTSEVNLAEMVKSRDRQVATLTEAQGTILSQQQTLIDEIRKQNERLDRANDRIYQLTDTIINL